MDFAQLGADLVELVRDIASGAPQRSLEDIGRMFADLHGQVQEDQHPAPAPAPAPVPPDRVNGVRDGISPLPPESPNPLDQPNPPDQAAPTAPQSLPGSTPPAGTGVPGSAPQPPFGFTPPGA